MSYHLLHRVLDLIYDSLIEHKPEDYVLVDKDTWKEAWIDKARPHNEDYKLMESEDR